MTASAAQRLGKYSFVLAWVGPVAFLLGLRAFGFQGFPLDDAWIHQTYARNLALTGKWAFAAGETSAGSTSPLWTLLLVPGYWLHLDPRAWAYATGTVLLGTVSLFTWLWLRELDARAALVASLVVMAEWHLVWAAVSGMEILLFTVWALGCFVLARKARLEGPGLGAAFALGLAAGLGPWIRPEAILAIPLVLAQAALRRERPWRPSARTISISAGILLPLLAYFAFNLVLGGRPWPNTFYSKQIEYQVLAGGDLVHRLAAQAVALMAGPLAVLLPGGIFWFVTALRRRDWAQLVPLVWVGLHAGAYALRLPVTYQHGRYLMPLLPFLVGWSVLGLFEVVQVLKPSRLKWVVLRAWGLALAAVALAFGVLGAQAYARDVGLIQTEMVAAAVWINANTPPGAVVAAHDIGALGYYGARRLVDLGGLIQAEAAEVLRDPALLPAYLDRKQADYLVAFPGLYPQVTRGCTPLYVTAGKVSPTLEGENLAVYAWPGGCAPAGG